MSRAIELALIVAFGAIIYAMTKYGLPPQPLASVAEARTQPNTCTEEDLDRLAPFTRYTLTEL